MPEQQWLEAENKKAPVVVWYVTWHPAGIAMEALFKDHYPSVQVNYHDWENLDNSDKRKEAMKEMTGVEAEGDVWVFVNGEFYGDSNTTNEKHQYGKLSEALGVERV